MGNQNENTITLINPKKYATMRKKLFIMALLVCNSLAVRSQGYIFSYNTPRFSDRHNYGGMTRNRYICKKEENQNGKTI